MAQFDAENCILGFHVLFIQTHKLLAHLYDGRADGSYKRPLQTYLRPLKGYGPEDLY